MVKILVAGIGNRLMSDDGFGSILAEKLANQYRSKNVEIIDYGLSIMSLLHDIEDYDVLVIIDTIKGDGKPGTVIVSEIKKDDIVDIDPSDASKLFSISYHEADLETFLALAKKLGVLPNKIYLVGVIPKEIKPGLGISRELEESSTKVMKLVIELINKLI